MPEERTLMNVMTREKGFALETQGKSITALEIEYAISHAGHEFAGFFISAIHCRIVEWTRRRRRPIPMPTPTSPRRKRRDGATSNWRNSNSGSIDTSRRGCGITKPPGTARRPPAWISLVTWFWMISGGNYRRMRPSGPASSPGDFELFITRLLGTHHGRGAFLQGLRDMATSPTAGPWLVCVIGESGMGKSAMFAQVYRALDEREDVLLLTHAAGINPESASINLMLRSWVATLAQVRRRSNPLEPTDAARPDGGLMRTVKGLWHGAARSHSQPNNPPATDNAHLPTPQQAFSRLLEEAAAKQRIVLLVDGLDQFAGATVDMGSRWLPDRCPENVRFVVFSRDGAHVRSLSGRPGVEIRSLPPLRVEDGREIIKDVYATYHRAVPEEVAGLLLEKQDDTRRLAYGNPLWVRLAAEELNLLDGDFFSLAQAGSASAGAEERLREMVLRVGRSLPAEVEGVYTWMLDRAGKAHGKEITDAFVHLVALSRQGWREMDLQPLLAAWLGHEVTTLALAQLRRAFRAQFAQRGPTGEWTFSHSQLGETVRKRNLGDPDLVRRLHRVIAAYLWELPEDDPVRQRELIYHLVAAGDQPRAAEYYSQVDGPVFAATTRELADHIVAGEAQTGNPNLEWACSLLRQPLPLGRPLEEFDRRSWESAAPDSRSRRPFTNREDVRPWRLCQRFLYGLYRELLQSAEQGPATRQRLVIVLLEATKSRIATVHERNLAHEELRHDYWHCLNLLAQHRRALGELDIAHSLDAMADALWDRERAHPDDPDYVSDAFGTGKRRAVTSLDEGDALYQGGKYAEALERYEQAQALLSLESLVLASYPCQTARCQEKIGQTLLAMKRPDEAVARFMEAHALHQQGAQRFPQDPVWHRIRRCRSGARGVGPCGVRPIPGGHPVGRARLGHPSGSP